MRPEKGAVSFVARIWLEHDRNGGPVWRGHVQHVQSGDERHFLTLRELCDFMEMLTGANCQGLWDATPEDIGMSERR